MATGNQVLPGAPVPAEHAIAPEGARFAGQAVVAEDTMTAGYFPSAGQPGARGLTAMAAGPPPKARRGAGGRWLVWLLRLVVWAVLLLVGYRGVTAIVLGNQAPAGNRPSAAAPGAAGPGGAAMATGPDGAGAGFPLALAQAYALEFGQVYLSFSPATAARRASALAVFLPPGTDPELGWAGTGTQSLQSEQVGGVQVLSAHSAIVTLLARVSGKLIELAVPVYWAHGGLVVSGQPALLPAPAQIAVPAPVRIAEDRPLERSLRRLLPAFFRAFAGGSAPALSRFAAPGVSLAGLGGQVAYGGISRLTVPAARSATRSITVIVLWRITSQVSARHRSSAASGPARIAMTYAMTVVWHGGAWHVRSIGAAAFQPGSPS